MLKKIALLFILAAFIAPASARDEPREISWEDLLPEDERQALYSSPPSEDVVPLFEEPGGQQHDSPGMQTGSYRTVKELDGAVIRMPGFMLPLEYGRGGVVSEFLLVPYFGACIHVPPPPPNQIVYVVTRKPIKAKGLWDPVWVTGKMSTDTQVNDLGDAAYTLTLSNLERYDE